MRNFWLRFRTAKQLGLMNIVRVAFYRLGVRTGLHPVLKLKAEIPKGPFFREVASSTSSPKVSQAWRQSALYFGFHSVLIKEQAPDWFLNPLVDVQFANPQKPWWQIPDFDSSFGDIKNLWEASRFEWALAFAERAKAGDTESLTRLNNWLSDWNQKNPPYYGPNWKCGQETSIRVMHLMTVAHVLGQIENPHPALLDLIELHLKRIFPTISYAIAQDNNHGTSEAAALFIGGAWLVRCGRSLGKKWEKAGRNLIENRVARLIGLDGSFSQYSLNYHRMMLDALSVSEWARQYFARPRFSDVFYARALAACRWLQAMINPINGDGPNLGANDGARIFPFTDTDYRDYRPSLQLAMVLFGGQRAIAGEGDFNIPLQWLGVSVPDVLVASPVSQLFDDGGFAVLIKRGAKAFLRYPRFKFRPSQADVLHVDLWVGEKNLLRDAGTFGYNVEDEWLRYFPGTKSHNTIEFDDQDQMPRLSRFLFGAWLKIKSLKNIEEEGDATSVSASYASDSGAEHERTVRLQEARLLVEDKFQGFQRKAVLRWRLEPGNWVVRGHVISKGDITLSIQSSVPLVRLELTTGWESRYYQMKEPVPVLEAEFAESGTVITECNWSL